MWNFVSPRIIFGEESLSGLEEITGNRALIITDQNLVEAGLVSRVTDKLSQFGFETALFDKIEPDPNTLSIAEGAAVATKYQPDWIIGVGGGSPLDAAKAIWVIYENPEVQPNEINPFVKLKLREKARLVTIPTTSGTGSEVTWAIVLTDPETNRKIGLGNRENVADLALVDPVMASSMPPQLTADTGMDALTHSIEGFICTWHNDISEGLCLNAAREIFRYLPVAYEASQSEQPDHEKYRQAREKMHNAATSAGLGFGNALSSLAHAMGHTLGALYHIPHGRAVGACLPYTIEFAARSELLRIELMTSILGIPIQNEGVGSALANAIRQLMHTIELPVRISDLGIPEKDFESDIQSLVEYSFNDAQILTAPRPPSYEELEKIFRYAYAGQPVDF
jgi:alcohol dehydrogenase class IV